MNEPTGGRFSGDSFDGSLVARVTDEIMDRLSRGEEVDIEEYVRRYPELADYLRGTVPMLEVMRDAGTSAEEDFADELSRPVTGRLGDFAIRQEIGRGSMGIVYEAIQLSLSRRVALKMLPYAAMLDPKRLQRFQNEAQAAAQMHHPHIVPVHFVGCERGVHFYAMQLIEGRSLAEVIDELRGDVTEGAAAETVDHHPGEESTARERPKRPTEADRTPTPWSSGGPREGRTFFNSVAQLGVQAARALDHAHASGILHRDVKPSNMLLDAGGHLWVSDFGLARVADGKDLTLPGDVLGTLAYMSPEAARGRSSEVDRRSDIYSLGASLYQLLTLQPVFTDPDRGALLEKIINDEPAPLRRHKPTTPVDLETIVLKALSKEQTDRYATAGELADDLERFIEEKPIEARRPSLMDRTLKWSRRHRTLVASIAIMLVLTTVGSFVAAGLLLREQAKTSKALEQAKANLHLAESHRQVTRQAVDDMYTKVATMWLVDQPQLTGLEKEFLEKALTIYEDLAKQDSADFNIRLDRATALLRAGNLHFKLGRHKIAETRLGTAIDELSKLTAESPDNSTARAGLSEAQQVLGRLCKRTGRNEQSQQLLRESIDGWARVVEDDPNYRFCALQVNAELHLAGTLLRQERIDDSGDFTSAANARALSLLERFPKEKVKIDHMLATSYQMKADISNNRDAPEEALKFLDASSRHVDSCREHDSSDRVYREADRFDNTMATTSLIKLQKWIRAEQSCRKALAISRGLITDYPLIPYYHGLLAQDHTQLAVVLFRRGEARAALESGQHAIEILDELLKHHADSVIYCSDFAYVHGQMGTIAASLSNPSDAVDHFETAIQRQEELFEKEPDVPKHRRQLAAIYADYAWFRVSTNDPSFFDPIAARQLAERALDLDPTNETAREVLDRVLQLENDNAPPFQGD